MPLGWLVVYCALFALAYGISVFRYRRKKLSLRRFAILQAVLIVAFPVAASLSLARETQRGGDRKGHDQHGLQNGKSPQRKLLPSIPEDRNPVREREQGAVHDQPPRRHPSVPSLLTWERGSGTPVMRR